MSTRRSRTDCIVKIHKSVPIVCVDLVVKHRKDFLLIKRKNNPLAGQWFLPGGRVLKGERLRKAVLRKLWEETGLKGKIKKFLGTGEHFMQKGYFRGIPGHTVTFVFLVETAKKDRIHIDSQSATFSWFHSVGRGLCPYVKDFLKKSGFE